MRAMFILTTFVMALSACTVTRNATSYGLSDTYDDNGMYLPPEAHDDPFGLEHYIQLYRYGS